MPNRSRSMFAWVPLPLPGAPYRRRFIELFDEAAVLAHDQLRLQLFHRVQGDGERDAIHDRRQVVRGRTSRADTRDEARVAFEVVGDVIYFKRNRGVEIR